jgi:SH3-like domain-containing protein
MCSVAVLLCVGSVTAQQLEITTDARMRAAPDRNAAVIGTVPLGTAVPMLEEQGAWYRIRHNGVEGWIFNELAKPVRAQAGEIFTRPDASMLPPGAPVGLDAETPRQQRFAQIQNDNTFIRENLTQGRDAPIIHTARRGEVLPLVDQGDSWCRVAVPAKDTTGFVLCRDLVILDSEPDKASIAMGDAKKLLFGLVIVGALVLIISGIITYRHVKAERERNVFVRKNALILAKERKEVISMLTNAQTTMEHCFSEIGFTVSAVKDSVSARNSISQSMPDLILVDWNFEPSIFHKIENLFARMKQSAGTYFIFYNVPDPSAVSDSKILKNVSFLGLTLTDRDIFKVVTPLLAYSDDDPSKNIQKSVQRCALEGEIAGGNLLEVLQFIEIGSKTGCLMIATKGPFGLVYFGDGRIIYAATTNDQGVEAVYSILNLPAGKFRFITNKQPKIANLNLPTLSVLMEWTKNKDEAHRG